MISSGVELALEEGGQAVPLDAVALGLEGLDLEAPVQDDLLLLHVAQERQRLLDPVAALGGPSP